MKDCPKRDNLKRGTFRGNYRVEGIIFIKVQLDKPNYAIDVETSKTEEIILLAVYKLETCSGSRIDFILDSGATEYLVTEEMEKYMTDL